MSYSHIKERNQSTFSTFEKIINNPGPVAGFVGLGTILYQGLKSFSSGDGSRSGRMMRFRVIAQASTLGIILLTMSPLVANNGTPPASQRPNPSSA